MMVGDVGEWWGGCEEEIKWLDMAESQMADHRPLAGSVTITKTQKEQNEVPDSLMHHFHFHFNSLCSFRN